MAKKKEKKGKKAKKNKKPGKKWENYKLEGDKAVRQGRFCPRCGPGVFLAKHKDRVYCGKCHYTEFERANEKK